MKKLCRAIRARRNRKRFISRSLCDPNTLTLMPSAGCYNNKSKEQIVIGEHCTLGCAFQLFGDGKVVVGKNTYIGSQTLLQAKESIVIGDAVMIANSVLIVDNNNHPVEPEMRLKMSACEDFMHDELWTWKYAESKPIVIEDNVWIGRDSRIMKGVRIGKGSVVALGSIVTKDVPPYSVVAGNPARVVKQLPKPEGAE